VLKDNAQTVNARTECVARSGATVEVDPRTAPAEHQAEAQAVVAQAATQAAAQAEDRGQAAPISPTTTIEAPVHVESKLTPRRKCSPPSLRPIGRRRTQIMTHSAASASRSTIRESRSKYQSRTSVQRLVAGPATWISRSRRSSSSLLSASGTSTVPAGKLSTVDFDLRRD